MLREKNSNKFRGLINKSAEYVPDYTQNKLCFLGRITLLPANTLAGYALVNLVNDTQQIIILLPKAIYT